MKAVACGRKFISVQIYRFSVEMQFLRANPNLCTKSLAPCNPDRSPYKCEPSPYKHEASPYKYEASPYKCEASLYKCEASPYRYTVMANLPPSNRELHPPGGSG